MGLITSVSDWWRGRAAGPIAGAQTLVRLPLSMQIQRIGGNVTPATVSAIIQEADAGVMYRLVDLANEARQKDGHLQSCLYTRETALTGLDWSIPPFVARGQDEPTEEDREIAGFVNDALRSSETPESDDSTISGFTDMLSHLIGATYHAYAVDEIDWKSVNGSLVPNGYWNISQRRFAFADQTGRLVWWDANGGAGRTEGVDLMVKYPGRFIQHQPRITGDVQAREGLSRVLIWPALFANWGIADWMKVAELSWKPWRIGKYRRGASTKDIDDLVSVLEQMAGTGISTHSEDVELDVKWPQGEGKAARGNHQSLVEYMQTMMSKAILGQTLTVEAGERGARSLGEVHDRVRKDIREGDARAVASTIRRDLHVPLVRKNFGPNAAIPGFRFETDDAVDLAEFATGISTLVNAGAEVTHEHVWNRAGLPTPKRGQRLLGGAVFGEEPQEPTDVPDDTEPEPDSVDVNLSDLDSDDETNDAE